MKTIFVVLGVIACSAAGTEIIVHLADWRFDDIGTECEAILWKAGYAAVLVSPVHEPPDMKKMPWYERYQVYSYNITTRSGDAVDLQRMTTRCHQVGIKVYVEVVLNHMTTNFFNYKTGVGGSSANPNDKEYPALSFTAEHFHPTCEIVDYTNSSNVCMCEYEARHDLNQKHEHVRAQQTKFLDQLIDLGVDGFKVCHSKYMFSDDLSMILSRVKNLTSGDRPFIYFDVDTSGPLKTKMAEEYLKMGPVIEYGFEKFMLNAKLADMEQSLAGSNSSMIESKNSVLHINSMDVKREWHIGLRKFRVLNSIMLAQPYGAYKEIMSSHRMSILNRSPPHYENRTIKHVEFMEGVWCRDPWNCEHREPIVARMAQFSKVVEGTNMTNFAVYKTYDSKQISFCRYKKGFVAINEADYSRATIRAQTCLQEGRYCNLASGSYIDKRGRKVCRGPAIQVDKDGMATVTFGPYEEGIVALHIQEMPSSASRLNYLGLIITVVTLQLALYVSESQ